MRITRWGEQGIRCAVHMAEMLSKGEKMVTAHDLSESLSIPIDYLRQILQKLKVAHIVETVRGPQGGYILARAPEEISLSDILYATEGDTFEIICEKNPLDESRCKSTTACGLKGIWIKLHDHVEGFLKGYSLSDLIPIAHEIRTENVFQDDTPIQIGGERQELVS